MVGQLVRAAKIVTRINLGKTHSENKIALELLINSCGLTMATVNKKQYLVMNNRFIEGTIKHNHHIFLNFCFLHVSQTWWDGSHRFQCKLNSYIPNPTNYNIWSYSTKMPFFLIGASPRPLALTD